MNYEKEYIDYLIENIKEIDTKILDNYFLNKLNFNSLIESINIKRYNIMSYTTWIKSRKIDELFN
jgi:hypothetical protein